MSRLIKKEIPSEKNSRLNCNGDAVALGYPVGITGMCLTGTLADKLRHRNLQYDIAIASICGGMGLVLLIENEN